MQSRYWIRDKTMNDKLMYNQNYPFCRSQIVVEKFRHWRFIKQDSIKVPKVLIKDLRKDFYNILGTILIYSLKSPPSLIISSLQVLLSVLGSEQRGGHVIRRLQQEVQKQAIKVI